MTKLLEIKDQLIRFYSKYETYLYPIVKFAVALALFTVINTNIGFMEKTLQGADSFMFYSSAAEQGSQKENGYPI